MDYWSKYEMIPLPGKNGNMFMILGLAKVFKEDT